MRIIEERDARTAHRKECKKIFDKRFSLSVTPSSQDDTYRLLDEGLITYADGSPQMYIKKGVIDKMLESMSDDYEGSINFGHHDLATDPISIIGEWRKTDLFVEFSDENDGRKVLNVRPHLWDDHIYVQQLKRQPYTYGLSAEFYGELDWDASEDMGIPVIGSIELLDFAIVGECGNVGSSDIHLRGEDVKKFDELKKKFMSGVAEEEPETVEETTEVVEEELSVEEEPETVEEDLSVDLDVDEEEEEVEEDDDDDIVEMIELLLNQVSDLKKENESLRADVDKLNAKLKKVKELKVSIGNSDKPEKTVSEKRYAGKDGIGEI